MLDVIFTLGVLFALVYFGVGLLGAVCDDDDTPLSWVDYALATIIGLYLAMAALSYFDILTKV